MDPKPTETELLKMFPYAIIYLVSYSQVITRQRIYKCSFYGILMSIESLLKPAKYADEQILRYYSKLTKKWEDKGHSRYKLAFPLNMLATSSLLAVEVGGLSTNFIPLYVWPNGLNFALSSFGLMGGNPTGVKNNGDSFSIENPAIYLFNKFGKLIRTPELFTGISLAGKGAYDIYNYLSNKEGSLSEGVNNLLWGVSLFSNASAWYIRDSDPKLLDKAPFWKTAYDKVKEKVKSLVPSPEPIPQPAFSMENYLPAN